jgi:actin-related protein 5
LEGRAYAKNALINAFVRGGQEGKYNPEDVKMNHQLHLNVERIRVPEAFFQPGMFGQDYAGIGELAGWIMNGYEEEQRRRMMQVSLSSWLCIWRG